MQLLQAFTLFMGLMGIIFGVLIIKSKSKNKKAKLFLSLIIFVLSIRMIDGYQFTSKHFVMYLFGYSGIFSSLIGYFFFRFICHIFDLKFEYKKILVFVSPLFIYTSYMVLKSVFDEEIVTTIINNPEILDQSFEYNLAFLVDSVLNIIFLVYSIYVLYKLNRSEQYSKFKNKILWLRKILFILIIITSISSFTIIPAFNPIDSYTNFLVANMLNAIVFIYIAASSMNIPIISDTIENTVTPSKSKVKYAKSSLTKDKEKEIYSSLIEIIEKDQIYRNNDLKIQHLAKKLDISVNHLSQTINQITGKTYNEFINSYRIEAAKQTLIDPKFKHYTILAVGLEVGFNSKASFYNVFKKYVKMTPTEFIKLNS